MSSLSSSAGIAAIFAVVALTAAFILSSILGLTTMIWPYTQTLFSDPTMGFFWMLSFYSLLAYRKSKNNLWLFLSGGALGFSALIKIVAVYAIPIFSSYFLYQLLYNFEENMKRRAGPKFIKPVVSFFMPIAVIGFVILKFNQLRYGEYFSFGYLDYKTYDLRDSIFGFNVPFLSGFYAQLLSSGKGFFFYNSSAFLGVLGWNQFCRRHPPEGFFLITLVGGMILIYSKWYGWHGDWSWGLRYLACLPPFFLLAAAPIFESLFDPQNKILLFLNLKRIAATALILVSLFVQILGLCIKSNDYILTAAEANVFKGKFYQANWPIRDDSMQLHFIPEFSPLAGHWWMLRVILNRNNLGVKEIFESPPWHSLNVNWIPKKMNMNRFRYNIWWTHILAANIKGTKSLLFFAGALGFGFFFLIGCGSIKAFQSSSKHQ